MAGSAPNATSVTVDAFHRGQFVLVQPGEGHHRSGLDAMLLAATVADEFSGQLADLGAGAGAAALAVLSRCERAGATLVENDRVMLDCARQTLERPENARFASRAEVIDADVTLSGADRTRAGLADTSFDHVIANPPFNDARDRQTPKPGKAAGHVIDSDALATWCRTAAAITRPGGRFSLIARPSMLGTILSALEGRFGGISIRPVHPDCDGTAIRILVSGVKGSRARPGILPPVVLHRTGGAKGFSDEADDLINGRTCLPMDL